MALTLPPGCPPDGNAQAVGEFFRLTNATLSVGQVPNDEEWILPVAKKASAVFQQYDHCGAYAHSIFSGISVLLHAKRTVPWARKKSISKVTLVSGCGLILETPSQLGADHFDWWPDPMDLIPAAVVVEGGASAS